jgi:hypothetical protein
MKSLTLPHALAYLFGIGAAALPVVQQFAPTLVPGPTGLAIAGGAGALLAFGHQLYTMYQSSQNGTVPAPSPGAVVKVLPLLLTAALVASLCGSLSACKTLPSATQQAGISAAVTVATGEAIQQGSTDSVTWRNRAEQFRAIAVQVKAVNDAGSASLATLAADLQPQLAKLGPADVIAANALVAALTPYLDAEIKAHPEVGNAQATVDLILAAVIQACDAYIPMTA